MQIKSIILFSALAAPILALPAANPEALALAAAEAAPNHKWCPFNSCPHKKREAEPAPAPKPKPTWCPYNSCPKKVKREAEPEPAPIPEPAPEPVAEPEPTWCPYNSCPKKMKKRAPKPIPEPAPAPEAAPEPKAAPKASPGWCPYNSCPKNKKLQGRRRLRRNVLRRQFQAFRHYLRPSKLIHVRDVSVTTASTSFGTMFRSTLSVFLCNVFSINPVKLPWSRTCLLDPIE